MKIKIDGVPGFNATYDLDMTYFTMRELHTVKTIAGVRAGEMSEAITAGDNDLMVAFAVIAVGRSGKTIHPDLLWDARSGTITVIADDVPEDEDPNPTVQQTPSSSSTTEDPKPHSSETSSDDSAVSPEDDPSLTGTPV